MLVVGGSTIVLDDVVKGDREEWGHQYKLFRCQLIVDMLIEETIKFVWSQIEELGESNELEMLYLQLLNYKETERGGSFSQAIVGLVSNIFFLICHVPPN